MNTTIPGTGSQKENELFPDRTNAMGNGFNFSQLMHACMTRDAESLNSEGYITVAHESERGVRSHKEEQRREITGCIKENIHSQMRFRQLRCGPID